MWFTSIISVTGTCQKCTFLSPLQTYWIRNSGIGPTICVLICPPGNSDACSSLRKNGLNHQDIYCFFLKCLEADSTLPGLWSSISGILLTFPSLSQNGCLSLKHHVLYSPCSVPTGKDKVMAERGLLFLNTFSFIREEKHLRNLLSRLPFSIHCPNLGLIPVPRQIIGKVG